ncbi:MAG: 30S ribosome-binding factor RbfA [Magnetococcales bacterium]|nr:30S ribosome-binding factor RbfA [Magnetococcales bacterium]
MTVRVDRMRELIRREIARMLERGDVRDPRLQGIISVTDVELSRDLQYATVFISVMSADAAEVLAGLSHAVGFMRGHLAKALSVRYAPQLQFREDTSFAYGQHIDDILRTLHIPPSEGQEH